MNPFLLLLLAYLLGATPTSLWVGKGIHGVDLRTEGSGNLGATNTFRVLGWKAALPVVVVDVLKGWFPAWFFPQIDVTGSPWIWGAAYGAAAIVGHVYSVWVHFRGGKGVATSGGVFLALTPWAVAVAFVTWLVALLATRTASVASIVAAVALPVAVAFTPHEGGAAMVAFTAALAVFVIWAHRSNVRRLLRGEEPRLGERVSAGGEARRVAEPDGSAGTGGHSHSPKTEEER